MKKENLPVDEQAKKKPIGKKKMPMEADKNHPPKNEDGKRHDPHKIPPVDERIIPAQSGRIPDEPREDVEEKSRKLSD